MQTLIRRVRARFARVDTGRNFIDACCHRIGGQLRAGPPRTDPADPRDEQR